MAALPGDDDKAPILEVQALRLVGENAALKAKLRRIQTSNAYRLVNRLRGRNRLAWPKRIGNLFRAGELALWTVAERLGLGMRREDRKSWRERIWAHRHLRQIAGRMSDGAAFLALSEAPGHKARLRVIVMGVGGVGDVLSTIVVATALERLLAPCEVHLAHTSRAVSALASNNPSINRAWVIPHADFDLLQAALATLDVFDLVVDHHYCVRYIRTASARIEEHLPPGHLLSAAAAIRPFVEILASWPFNNNLLGSTAQRAGLSALDLAGATGQLNLGANSHIPLYLTPEHHVVLDRFDVLKAGRYVTVHNGVDNVSLLNLKKRDGRPTKLLPRETWAGIVTGLKAEGFVVAQLGESADDLIEGVDCDLRSCTSLFEAAVVLKFAGCHIDTEGGLVHLARAVHCPSVVVFGPTPVGFFGYRQNVNIGPAHCGDCWWSTPEWLVKCPLKTAGPLCMVSHSAQTVTDGALSLISARPEPGYRIEAAELFAALPPDDIDAAIGSAAAVCNQGPTTGQPAVTLAREPSLSVRQTWELSFIVRNLKAAGTPLDGAAVAHVGGRNEAGPLLAGFGANVEMIAVAPFDGEGIAETGGLARSANWRFGSVHNLPAESDAYAVVTSTGAMNGIAGRAYALRELLRIVRPGGLLCLTFSISSRGPEGIAPTTAGDLDGASLKAILQDAGLPDRPFGEDEVRASVQAMSRATNDARRDTTIAGLLIRRTK